jgi:hypothetical protein
MVRKIVSIFLSLCTTITSLCAQSVSKHPELVYQLPNVPPPTVTNINPNSGSRGGGNTVTITGTNFQNVNEVDFGPNHSTTVIVLSSTQITALAPAGMGTVDVIVTTAAGSSTPTAADQYTYLYIPPNKTRKFHGKLYRKYHLGQDKNFLLKTSWKAPNGAPAPVAYVIYEDGQAKYSFPATGPLKFEKYVRSSKNLHKRYSITSVSSSGAESVKKKLKIVNTHTD